MVSCHCVLPQFRNAKNKPYHNFIVFSLIDKSDSVIPKHAKCNNCGIIHNIYDLGKSEILIGQEEGAVMEIKDISLMIPGSLKNILENYDCDIPTWEQVLHVIQNEDYPIDIILTRLEEEDIVSGKLLSIEKANKYQIKPYSMKILI